MTTLIKICGLTDGEALETAIESGANFAGLTFYGPSPRNIDLDRAAALADQARGRIRLVAVSVNAEDGEIAAIADRVKPDFLQLHGSESPDRCVDVAKRTGIGTIKALGVSDKDDLAKAGLYESVCDYLLLDAKAPKDASRPGGLGKPFDWSVLTGFNPATGWLLAGGLNADNIGEALTVTGAPGVDLSSSVEREPGVKDPDLIREFIDVTRRHDAARAA